MNKWHRFKKRIEMALFDISSVFSEGVKMGLLGFCIIMAFLLAIGGAVCILFGVTGAISSVLASVSALDIYIVSFGDSVIAIAVGAVLLFVAGVLATIVDRL